MLQEAEHFYRSAIALEKRHLGAWLNLGAILRSRGSSDEASQTWRAALEQFGISPELRFNLGCALLQSGRWREGWSGYEERWTVHGWRQPVAASHCPRWVGQPLQRSVLLVHHEQGLGDTLQFIRLLPVLGSRAETVRFVCPTRIHRLLRSSPILGDAGHEGWSIELVGDTGSAEGAAAWIPLLSVPDVIQLEPSTLPADVPYLAAEEELVERWRRRLNDVCPRRLGSLRVGICWQGNPAAPADAGRSLPLALVAPLAQIEGVQLVSLQKDHGRDQLSAAPPGMIALDLGNEIDTADEAFVDTAALLHELDLLVTTDTAVAHLAGAMGRPVWVLLKNVPDWRWGRAVCRTPWYPTMRLFHQPEPGDWRGAVDRVVASLEQLITSRRSVADARAGRVDPTVALASHRAGRIDEAIECYRGLLRDQPDRSEISHLLAVAIFEAEGRTQQALARALVWAERAAELAPRDADAHANLGYLLKAAGRFGDAEIALLHALSLTAWAHEAAAINLVNLLIQAGEGARAVDAAQRSLAARGSTERMAALARALDAAGRRTEAIAAWERVVACAPEAPAHHVSLGAARANAEDPTAVTSFERALELDPDQVDALTNLGVLERATGDPCLATWFHRVAVSRDPTRAEAWTNLGVSLLERGLIEAAQDAFRTTLTLRPGHADAEMALGMSFLLQGRFEEGLAAYESRRRSRAAVASATPPPGSEWAGGDPRGLRLLLICEQGFGDALQFVRYAAVLKERGARTVAIGCRAPLARLLARANGVDTVVAEGAKLPDFDAWAPMMSLPRLLGTRLGSIPAPAACLSAEPERVIHWASVLAAKPGLRVGLAWQGNPDRRVDRGRSIRLSTLAPLMEVPRTRLISLQKGAGIDQLAEFPGQIEILAPDLDPGPDAFLDTAAVMANLDLVITTDTAVAHLAGALGRPVWLLLKHPPEWRWLLDRHDSPWYPTMRLFRQDPEADTEDPWTPVVARVTAELRSLASGDRSRLLPIWVDDPRPSRSEDLRPSTRSASGGGASTDFERALELHRAGERKAAGRIYSAVLAAQPDHRDALHMMGVLALQEQRPRRALIYLREACRGGRTPEMCSNLGLVMKALGRLAEAEQLFREAVARREGYGEALVNLGNLLRETDRPAEAIVAFDAACRTPLGGSAALRGLGNALRETGSLSGAIEALEAAVGAQPDDAEAHVDLAHALLAAGDLRRGFAEYEWRWRGAELRPRRFEVPRWDGRPFPGRTLLVHGEQGLGDHIQLVRLLKPAAELGGRVILECRRELLALIASLAAEVGGLSLVAQGEALPAHDLEVPLASLPHLLGLELGSIPARVPYLRSDPGRRTRWRAWLGDATELQVGLVWQGNPRARADRGRSVPLRSLAPLLSISGAQFVSLQKEHGLDQLDELPPGSVRRPEPGLDGGPDAFLDTAALLDELDLLITSDTAVAHLAGALGRPVWLLLKFAPDWRWLSERQDSPWYPTMRLYRQSTPGDWAGVVERVGRDLRCLVDGRAAERRPLR
jgi:tetratricopeptide (TPR) repeat protein